MPRYFRHYKNGKLYELLHIARVEADPDKKIVCPWVFVYADKNNTEDSQPEFYILTRDEAYRLINESNDWYANQWNRTLKVGYQVGIEVAWLKAEGSPKNGSLHEAFDSTLKETSLGKWEKLPL